MRQFIHTSWFSKVMLRGKKIYEMCQFCGNDNKRKNDCNNCDIGFETYILIEDEK